MKKLVARITLLVSAMSLAALTALPANAQSLTVCVDAHVAVAGTTVIDQPSTCTTLPPA